MQYDGIIMNINSPGVYSRYGFPEEDGTGWDF